MSNQTIQKARLLRAEKGILAFPEETKHQKINQEVINTISNFYCDDEVSRQLPGKKDYVSIGKNNHV